MLAEPVVVRRGDGVTKGMRYGRGSVQMLVGPADGAVQLDMHINLILPGSAPGPRHFHSTSENAFFVIAGEGSVVIGDDEYLVSAGDFLFIPPGVTHSVSNAGASLLQVLEIYSPAAVDFVEV